MTRRLLLLLLCALPWCPLQGAAEEESVRDGVFVHVSHGTDHPHRLLMALRLARIMAETRDVLVFFDVDGVRAILEGAEDVEAPGFESLSVQLEALRVTEAVLLACPMCVEAAGAKEEDLVDGVQYAEADRFFSFTEGRILTLDY